MHMELVPTPRHREHVISSSLATSLVRQKINIPSNSVETCTHRDRHYLGFPFPAYNLLLLYLGNEATIHLFLLLNKFGLLLFGFLLRFQLPLEGAVEGAGENAVSPRAPNYIQRQHQ